MNISAETSTALDLLVGKFFDLNRSFDRAVSILENKWAMPNAADIIHHKLAHLFPLMADIVSGFKDKWNVMTVYLETHEDNRDYTDLNEMMETLFKEVLDTCEIVKMVYGVAESHGDFNAMAMLIDLMNKMTDVIAQVNTLKDKAEQMPDEYDVYDNHISAWGIVGLDLGE